MRDIVNHYRTLVAEALDAIYYDERGEALGRRADDLAGRLARKIRPPRPDAPAPSLEGWQPMGWIDADSLPSFAAFTGVVNNAYTDATQAYLDDIVKRMVVPQAPMPEWASVRTAEAVAKFRETMPRTSFDTSGINPWQEQMQESVNNMVDRLVEIQETGMRATMQETFIVGVDPESEWTKISRASIEKMATLPVGEDRVADWVMGIPLYPDPDDDTMLRMKTADIYGAPNGPKIMEAVFGLSDPADTFVTDASPEPAKDATDD